MATVNCAVTKGDIPINITWRFNQSPLRNNNDGVLITKSGQRISILNIESVQARHRGVYTCIASNAAGTVEHSAELHVNS